MWMRNSGIAAGACLCAATVLLGCGGDGEEPGASADVAVDPEDSNGRAAEGGVYEGELADGSTLVIHLDVPATDPDVAPFEAFRGITGGAEPTWIVGEVTVPAGADGTGRFITFLEPGADRLEDDPADRSDGVTNSDFACAVIEDWFQATAIKDQALSDAYMEVYDGPCGGQAHQVLAPAGETTTYVMVYDGDLPDFDTIEAELGNALSSA